jgi:hypothetical protein
MNFRLTLAERIRALEGLPAHLRRKREIEDLVELLSTRRMKPGERMAMLARVNELIERHNRYYPIEANLAMDPRHGVFIENGVPWTPLPLLTL